MKSAFISLVLVFGFSTSMAATESAEKKTQYMISASIYVDGKLISRPRIATMAGEEAFISQKDEKNANLTTLKIVASESETPNNSPEKAVLLDMEFHYKKDGKEVRSKPQILILEGKTGSIEVGEESGPNFKIEVVANKIL